jgi:AraC-like DNA-binding protein
MRETVTQPLLETKDIDEARQHITSVYIPHDLTSRDNRPLDFKLCYLQSKRLTLGHLRYGADAELLCPPMESCYHVNLTLEGMTQVCQGGSSASTDPGKSGVIFNLKDSYTVRWSPEAVQYAIKIPRTSMESQLAALIGRPVDTPIEFSLGFDLTSPQGQSLLAAVHHLRTELTRPGGISDVPLIRAQLESYVLSQMLLVIPHDHQHLLIQSSKAASRQHVRMAIEFIENHAAEPITGVELARTACVSVRALQMGFHEELGMSPMAYVRNMRLDKVHEELLAGAGNASVSEAASRWGFHHLGRFAEQYRRKFGVLPSETAHIYR